MCDTALEKVISSQIRNICIVFCFVFSFCSWNKVFGARIMGTFIDPSYIERLQEDIQTAVSVKEAVSFYALEQGGLQDYRERCYIVAPLKGEAFGLPSG